MCPRPETQLNNMIYIALTTEFRSLLVMVGNE